MDNLSWNNIYILGIKISLITVRTLNNHIGYLIENDKRDLVHCVNIHKMNLAYKDRSLRNFLNEASIVFCDGAGVMLGARILGKRIPERITYGDWLWSLAEFAETRGITFYFLGNKPGVAEKAKMILKNKFPKLAVNGIHHGYFDKSPDSSENETIIREINEIKPNILIVGFGRPAQEKWLIENWERLNANVALTGGGAFDIISGVLQRGPKWMTNHGLEWLARMFIEPRRLWKRYLIGNPLFIGRVLLERLGLLSFQERKTS